MTRIEAKVTPLASLTDIQPRLSAIEAQDVSLELKENEITLDEVLAINEELQQAVEAKLGSKAVSETLRQSGFPFAFLPYRLLFPASAFEAYLGMYSQFDPQLKNSPVPAEDVYVLTNQEQNPIAYLQRSSLWSAVVDGVATARANLTQPGKIINVGGVQPCFRREVKETVKGWRQLGFTQANIELAALTDEQITTQSLDILSVAQMIKALETMGVPQAMIQIRVNNFMQILYTIIGNNISFLEKEQFGWETLDKMATARIIGNWDEHERLQKKALDRIQLWEEESKLSPSATQFLIKLIDTGRYDENLLQDAYPEANCALTNLKALVDKVASQSPRIKICIDPFSIRGGTPGYDRNTMQADIITPQQVFPEIAGGGAYQAAAKLSWRVLFGEEPPPNFYMVGFALGLLRIKTALDSIQSEA